MNPNLTPSQKFAELTGPTGALQRLLPWAGTAGLYCGTTMLAAGFLAKRAVQLGRSPGFSNLDAIDQLASLTTQAASWWVPESTAGFMVALAMILLGMALLTPAGGPGPRRGSALAGRA